MYEQRKKGQSPDLASRANDGSDGNEKPKDIDLSKEEIHDAGLDIGKEGLQHGDMPEDKSGLRDAARKEQAEQGMRDYATEQSDSPAHDAKRAMDSYEDSAAEQERKAEEQKLKKENGG